MNSEKVSIYEMHNEYFLGVWYLQKCKPYMYQRIVAKELSYFSLLVFSSLYIKFLRFPHMYGRNIDHIVNLAFYILDVKSLSISRMHLRRVSSLLDSVLRSEEIDTPENNEHYYKSEIQFIKINGIKLSEMTVKEINRLINARFKESLEVK